MAGSHFDSIACKKLRNLPNFRQICVKNGDDDNSHPSGLLYRSSRPDFLTDTEVCELKRLGIRSVVDFRSPKEYAKANGQKRLDKVCTVYAVKIPRHKKYKPQEGVKYKLVLSKDEKEKNSVGNLENQRQTGTKLERNGIEHGPNVSSISNIIHQNKNIEGSKTPVHTDINEHDEQHSKTNSSSLTDYKLDSKDSESAPVVKHYLINFFTSRFIWTVFQRAPWYIKMYALLWLVVDLIFRTGYLYFVQTFAKYVLNPNGLLAQYKDIIDLSHRSICAALKLLSDSDNIPAIINCAHGKDRTGIVTALVMYCLGKSNEEIAEEYSRSEEGLRPVKERIHKEIVENFHFSEEFTTAEQSTMLQLLDYISEKYGSVSNYLEYIGFSSKEQEELKRNLICTEL